MGNLVTITAETGLYETVPQDWPWIWAIRNPEVLDWKKNLTRSETLSVALQQAEITSAPLSVSASLYLGSSQGVQNVTTLQNMGITHVLNMAGPLAAGPVKEYARAGITYHEINAEDEEGYPLLGRHWEEARNFLGQETMRKCVVHCHAGINRSATIVAACLLMNEKSSLLQAVQRIRKARGNMALSNESFQEQVVALARLQNALGKMPEGAPLHYDAQRVIPRRKKAKNALDQLMF